MFRSFRDLRIRWKILVVVLPLVVLPIVLVTLVTGYVAERQAYRGITHTSEADLDHMAAFTLGLLDAHVRRLDGSSRDAAAYEHLKQIIHGMKVGHTGYIYCLDNSGTLTIHPAQEGVMIADSRDSDGVPFIAEMLKNKSGWIRYPWRNPGEAAARMKIVRYVHFKPWDWIVAVGSYENEFYEEANKIKQQMLSSTFLIMFGAIVLAVVLMIWVSTEMTDPLSRVLRVVRNIKKGRYDERIPITGRDEIGELAENFNTMLDLVEHHQEIEKNLNQQARMASLGVMAAELAHEINNPLGFILSYASHLEGKIAPDDPLFKYVAELRNESRRCKSIVENFLSYARIPAPDLKLADINAVLGEIVDFASSHPDLKHVEIVREFGRDIPLAPLDRDQMRQVAINLIINAAAAIEKRGTITIATRMEGGSIVVEFADTGSGIPEENRDRIFELFFTTKQRGTGLGLAISRQIVRQHFGTLTLERTSPGGTVFAIRLPASGGVP